MICIALHQSCQMVAQIEIQVYLFMHLLKHTAYPSIYCRAKGEQGNSLNVSQGFLLILIIIIRVYSVTKSS